MLVHTLKECIIVLFKYSIYLSVVYFNLKHSGGIAIAAGPKESSKNTCYSKFELSDEIPRGKVVKATKKKVIVDLKGTEWLDDFKGFYYVLDKENAAIAKLATRGVKLRQNRSTMRIICLAKGYRYKDLKNLTVIKSTVLQKDNLFEIKVSDSTVKTRITKIMDENLVINIARFIPKVELNEIFFVLTPDKTAVIAEGIIKKLSKNENKALVSITRIVKDVESSSLIGFSVIRSKDIAVTSPSKESVPITSMFNTNPLVGFYINTDSSIAQSVNFLTNTNIDPITSSYGVLFESFLWANPNQEWPNWLGIRLGYNKINETNIILRRTRSEYSQKAIIGGNRMRADLAVRRTLRDSFFARFALYLSVFDKRKEYVDIEEKDQSVDLTAAKLTLNSTGNFVGLELVINPMTNLLLGTTLTIPVSNTYTAKDETTNLEAKGKWHRMDFDLWCEYKYFFGEAQNWSFIMNFFLTYRNQKVEAAAELDLPKKNFIEYVYKGQIGVGYTL